MFSGIIEGRARLISKDTSNNIVKMQFEVSDTDISNLKMGASIAINGVCLTAMENFACSSRPTCPVCRSHYVKQKPKPNKL